MLTEAFVRNCFEWLNHYANLFLVIITSVYVGLTYMTLQTLNRANLREREAKHLDDIKASVAEPLLLWIAEVVDKLQGRQSTVVLLAPSINGPAPEGRNQISPATLFVNAMNRNLYLHSKEHFPEQLREFDPLHNAVERLVGDIAVFATKCCDVLWKKTNLSPFRASEPFVRFVNFESLMFVSLHYLLCGKTPEVFIQSSGGGMAVVTSRLNAPGIMQDLEDNIRYWLPQWISEIEDRWKGSGLSERVRLTLADAERMRSSIEDVQINYALNSLCQYVGK